MKRCCGIENDCPAVISELSRSLQEARVVDAGQKMVVPIHFHICYPNPNLAQVQADVVWTLEMMNRDFNGNATNKNANDNSALAQRNLATYTNYKSRMGSMNIQFTLASIVYVSRPVQTTSNLSILDANIKSYSPAITPESCLNVWVADVTSGLLGYAQFPWQFNEVTKKNDGVLVVKEAFGQSAAYPNFRLNKTVTHEVGHWFGLYHTFQNTLVYQGGNIDYLPGNNEGELKGDCVVDTPPQAVPTYGNPFLSSVWPSSKSVDETENAPAMIMNFMDYVDDDAMFIFTAQQVDKMRQMVYLYRPGIITPALVIPLPPVVNPPPVIGLPPVVNPPPVVSSPYFSCNFENPNDAAKWTLTTNAKIDHMLILKNVASAECKIDLSALQKSFVTLQFNYLSTSSTAKVSIKGPGDANWKRTPLVISKTMKSQTVKMMAPFKKGTSKFYLIRFDVAQSGKLLNVDDISIN